eukprot:3010395-Pleurochrysis_carterae.AAC.1
MGTYWWPSQIVSACCALSVGRKISPWAPVRRCASPQSGAPRALTFLVLAEILIPVRKACCGLIVTH